MIEILYIPSGKYFRFYPVPSQKADIIWSAEEFLAWNLTQEIDEDDSYIVHTYKDLLDRICKFSFNYELYKKAEIHYLEDPKPEDYLNIINFEMVDPCAKKNKNESTSNDESLNDTI